MVNHKTVEFKAENYSFHLGIIGLYFGNLGKKFVSFKILATYIQKESNFMARSRQSRRDVENLAANSTRFEKPTNITARSLRSRHDICWFLKHHGEVSTNLGEISVISVRWRISRRDLACHECHGKISTISARSWQSRRVLGSLGEMEDISPRSHRDLESNKHHGEISARSLQSRRDLGKNFARV